jgi:hypothetical protein
VAYTVLLERTRDGRTWFESIPDLLPSMAGKTDPWTFGRKHDGYSAMVEYVVQSLGYLPDTVVVDRQGNKTVKAYIPIGEMDGTDMRAVLVKAGELKLNPQTRAAQRRYKEQFDQKTREAYARVAACGDFETLLSWEQPSNAELLRQKSPLRGLHRKARGFLRRALGRSYQEQSIPPYLWSEFLSEYRRGLGLPARR